ncbi:MULTISPECIES: ATP-dependent Clp protease proteolytic subunit [Streptomyces]|uniref:ATP-dependent Clp protease proteolytic subunit n=1 Tax=Streptomyces tendae TaxID=1932 RepID=A0A6B3QUB6_STRTE|nr:MULTISPECIES: ATP-dependent Clp protease proteolytic subunit [Streptomyces]MBQ0962184.1 ATP-dependent Clp protease proteolytic subunit [Streptomyces sp. RK74B]MBQ1001966.1 ATP-dependent Clp protease proteolytic subunit [Streptomyces sp. RK23]MCW1092667.1 ATP-dependent Clp protease proteolytic subunit [Streptomyces sp. RS2]MZG15050.1 ATP-dependent Clp protease proteolytic subunit [Streptomyces sp. SID5914]NEV90820.1 ATP-dependent Clp protease proteolytic subunit [Streptomyces tendae]
MTRPSARHVLPEFTERTGAGTRTSDPYSKLLQERVVFLGTPIDDSSANDVTAQFLYLEHRAPDRDIELCVNSPGGSFTAMTAIYDTMRHLACDVATTCLGQAGSSAAVLLAAGAPGKRAVLPGARVVIHQPALTEPVAGRASDLAVHAAELLRVRARLEEILVRHTGRTPEQVRADIERDTVLDAQQALEYGLVDRIVPGRRTPPASPGAR